MKNAYDILEERGFIEQATHPEEIRELLGTEAVTFYIGFDPTADSLTAGHFLQVMAMAHMQQAGHRPIALVGSGTGMVGDPTDKTEMRRMMTLEEIQQNAAGMKQQLSKFIEFGPDQAIMVDNADWLLDLNYVQLLREVGVHFSVNRMLTADCYKSRYERGLTFLEFNYMIMQSYDFLELFRRHNCSLQLGGNDQWSNILGGVELIRRVERQPAFGMTFRLLTNSEGQKMGKTVSGAVWLDPDKTSPYDFYQYWRNVEDASVENCLGLLTFLPMDEVRRLGALQGQDINHAKEVLAHEITKIVHGQAEADKAQTAAKALFAGAEGEGSIPTTTLARSSFVTGMNLISLLQQTELIGSRSEGRRLIQQGGIYLEGNQVKDFDYLVTEADFTDEDSLLIRKGKKAYHRVQLG